MIIGVENNMIELDYKEQEYLDPTEDVLNIDAMDV